MLSNTNMVRLEGEGNKDRYNNVGKESKIIWGSVFLPEIIIVFHLDNLFSAFLTMPPHFIDSLCLLPSRMPK